MNDSVGGLSTLLIAARLVLHICRKFDAKLKARLSATEYQALQILLAALEGFLALAPFPGDTPPEES